MPRIFSVLIGVFMVTSSGCATQLTENAKHVRLISVEQKTGCRFIQVVSAVAKVGSDKPGNALRAALNQVSSLGGDSLYISSQTIDWAEGASVTGEALKCGGA